MLNPQLKTTKATFLGLNLAEWPVFWIAGLGLCLSWFLYHFSGRVDENFEYFAFAFGCPLLFLCAFVLSGIWQKRWITWAQNLFASLFFVFAFKYLTKPDFYCFALSAAQVFLLWRFKKYTKLELLFSFVLTFLVWCFARRLVWWQESWIFQLIYSTFALLFSFTIINLLHLFPQQLEAAIAPIQKWKNALNVFFILIFMLASWRVDFDFVHWSGYVGPVTIMRQGGALLWDALSFYGFLNVVLVYLVPVASPWQALYLVNAPFTFAGALIFYSLLKKSLSGLTGQIFAFIITFLFIFFIAGTPQMAGPNAFPMIGPFRFIWVYSLLLNIWVAEEKRESGKSLQKNIWIGNALWLVSAFWSAESLGYCTVIWFSYCALHFFWKDEKIKIGANELKEAVLTTVVPFGAFALIHLFIYWFYQKKFGHPPDWFQFVEVAAAFRRGFDCLLIDPKGGVWILYFLFVLQMMLLLRGLASNRRALRIAVPAFLGSWMVMSYFVGRSHENNIRNCLPIAVLALFVIARAIRFSDFGTKIEKLSLKLVFIPIFAVCMEMTVGQMNAMGGYVLRLFAVPHAANVDAKIPEMDEEVALLMDRAGVKTSDSIVQLDRLYPLRRHPRMESPPNPTLWLPVMPEYHYCGGAGPGRVRLYIERYAKDVKRSGWLLVRKIEDDMHCLADGKIISEFYTKAKTFESEHWFLDYYEIKPL